MGWSLHVPGYFNDAEYDAARGGPLWWAEALAPFPAAARSPWFKKRPDHYAVCGGHMGLGEDRKTASALKTESTAWMLRIDEAIAE